MGLTQRSNVIFSPRSLFFCSKPSSKLKYSELKIHTPPQQIKNKIHIWAFFSLCPKMQPLENARRWQQCCEHLCRRCIHQGCCSPPKQSFGKDELFTPQWITFTFKDNFKRQEHARLLFWYARTVVRTNICCDGNVRPTSYAIYSLFFKTIYTFQYQRASLCALVVAHIFKSKKKKRKKSFIFI